ncbi:MAG: NADH-quinone oxidoreductase subunit NuoB [Candidatus Cloacimonetes bacterium]|nr:NADH-quinone oxidoreductase subunit NuoB [Candidatus Cloacimonadota bacterium]
MNCFKKSLWLFHFAASSCNNCDIEILDCLTPRFDVERFGMKLVGSARHADVILVSGCITKKSKSRLQEIYNQTAKPCVVIAIGSCAITGGMFTDSYNFDGPTDKVVPVAAYVPGCPPKPEAMLSAVVKLLGKL